MSAGVTQASADDARTDGDLLAAAQQGQFAAFEMLVARYYGRLHRLATVLTRGQPEAEEVVRDAFLSIYRSLHQYDGRATPQAWIYRIAASTIFMRLRQLRRKPLLAIADEEPMQASPVWPVAQWTKQPLETLLNDELRTEVEGALARMPERYGAVLILRDVEGLGSAATAEALGLSITAVKTRLHRARLFMRGELERYFRNRT